MLGAAHATLDEEPGVELDYLTLTSPDLGEPPVAGEARLLVAARVGTVRLIDNVPVHLQVHPQEDLRPPAPTRGRR